MTEKKSALTAATVQSANVIEQVQNITREKENQVTRTMGNPVAKEKMYGISNCLESLISEAKGIEELTFALSLAMEDTDGFEHGTHLLANIMHHQVNQLEELEKKVNSIRNDNRSDAFDWSETV